MDADATLGAFLFVFLTGFAIGGGIVASVRDWRKRPGGPRG